MPRLSIVIRFRNEARYLEAVLRAVRSQRQPYPVEVVAVDNQSTDGSRAIAEVYADKILDIPEYRPGAALNKAIEACSGEGIVILSAHALPADDTWLGRLGSWIGNVDVLGTYGAQIYPITSRFLDKRDLDIFSDLRPRAETNDSDFWNANSAFRRGYWEKEPFDELVIELEDHYWTKRLLTGGRWVRFEPTAVVYHYGHEARNDREFLPPSPHTDEERIAEAVQVLSDSDQPWPVVMSAGLTLGTLSHHPAALSAVPALGRSLREHEDFDARWRMAGALGRIRCTDSAGYLVDGLRDRSFYARDECAWALARLGDLAVPTVLRHLPALDPAHTPFAGLALGMSGVLEAERQAVELFRGCIAADDTDAARDGLYFLGEMARATPAQALAGQVVTHLHGDDDALLRAAAWCWGRLVEASDRDLGFDEQAVVDLARLHPLETVRAEAVVALGKLARARRSPRMAAHVARSIRDDGSGRVRYSAMQVLRLAAADGLDCLTEVVTHDADPDFGVLFERQLMLEGVNGES